MDKPNYYAILPANVRYDTELQPIARLLYAEISCLTNSTGVCSASNEYFSKLYDMHEVSISRIVNKLKAKGYINISYKKFNTGSDRKEIREITLNKLEVAEVIEEPKVVRVKKTKLPVEMYEYEFIKMPKDKYDKLIEEYGFELIDKQIVVMVNWCNGKKHYYKDYYKALVKWLEGAPKVSKGVEITKTETIETIPSVPLFDIQGGG